MKGIVIAIAAAMSLPAMAEAQAQPIEGIYVVEGGCPGQPQPYHGMLTITRSGPLYSLRWEIGGEVSVGRGIEQDGRLGISYVLNGDTGLMIARPTATGWEGRWSLNRGGAVCTERWRRR